MLGRNATAVAVSLLVVGSHWDNPTNGPRQRRYGTQERILGIVYIGDEAKQERGRKTFEAEWRRVVEVGEKKAVSGFSLCEEKVRPQVNPLRIDDTCALMPLRTFDPCDESL